MKDSKKDGDRTLDLTPEETEEKVGKPTHEEPSKSKSKGQEEPKPKRNLVHGFPR